MDKSFADLPLKLTVGYLFFTLFLYAFGPFDWVTYEPLLFWSLNLIYILMFVLGWKFGKRIRVSSRVWDDDVDSGTILFLLKILITFVFVDEMLIAMRRLQMNSFSISNLILNIYNGLLDMGASYGKLQIAAQFGDKASAYGGIFVTLYSFLCSFFTFNVLALGFLYFRKLSVYNKITLLLTYLLIILQFAATGTNIGVFRIVLMFLILYVVIFLRNSYIKTSFKKKLFIKKLLSVIMVALVGVLYLFQSIMDSRGGILRWDTGSYNVGGITINGESLFFVFFPESIYRFLIAISSYLCQGYYGMSLCLRVPWEPCFGLGHSMALINSLKNNFSFVYLNSYQHRIQIYGWDEYMQWHTMYSWFANDITFLGVIFVMFGIACFFSMAYRDSIVTNNPFAKILLFYFALMIIFIPCNNQLFQGYPTMFSFIVALILWLYSRGKRRVVLSIRKEYP